MIFDRVLLRVRSAEREPARQHWPWSLSSGSNAIFEIITSRSQVFFTVK
jgi:hypothetical protein